MWPEVRGMRMIRIFRLLNPLSGTCCLARSSIKGNSVKLQMILCFRIASVSVTLCRLAAHCGLKYFHTQKLEWRNKPFYSNGWKIPFHVGWWEGAGGAKLLSVMDGGNYSWDPAESNITDDKDFKYRLSKSPVNAVFRYYGTKSSRYEGDRGGSPLPSSLASICVQASE